MVHTDLSTTARSVVTLGTLFTLIYLQQLVGSDLGHVVHTDLSTTARSAVTLGTLFTLIYLHQLVVQ